MLLQARDGSGGSVRFFRLSFGDDELKNYYRINFNLLYHHQMDPEMFDRLIPWERDLYLTMLMQKVEEENERLKQIEAERRVKGHGNRK